MLIGIISDTHNFLDPSVRGLFNGVEHILHAGDIGRPSILSELEEIAPVTCVSGNTDDPGFGYSLTQVRELGGLKFLLHHIVNPHRLEHALEQRLQTERPHVVVFGHTHKPFNESINRILFFNPGYAGKPRFGLTRSVALLHLERGRCRPQFLMLE